VYLDVTTPCLGQIIDRDVAEKLFFEPIDLAPAMPPSPPALTRAMELIAAAKRPVLLIGKGAAYAQIEDELKRLVDFTGIPYYMMSMAKGMLDDDGPRSKPMWWCWWARG
jgi:oxalyl-CoA decarboxylase